MPRGGAPVDFQVDDSEIIFYKHGDYDDERPPPEWDSEEELSDLDPWLADSSEGEKWTDVCNSRRGGRAISPVAKSLMSSTPPPTSTSTSPTSKVGQCGAELTDTSLQRGATSTTTSASMPRVGQCGCAYRHESPAWSDFIEK